MGLKTEGRVSLKEFGEEEGKPPIKVGDTVEVFLERVENAMGEAVLSRDKARREGKPGRAWKPSMRSNEPVMGSTRRAG